MVPVVHPGGDGVAGHRKLIAMYDTRDSAMTVKVTGYQWMWKYEYLGEGVDFTSRLDRESDAMRQSGADADRGRPSRTTCSTSTTRWCCRPTPRSAS